MIDDYPRLAVVSASRATGNQLRVDVSYSNHGAADRDVPVAAPHGMYAMPKSGDRVVVDEIDDGSVVAMPISISTTTVDVPDLVEGEFEFRFDEGTAVSVRKAGGSFNVSIEASGDVAVSAAGSVTIDGTDWRTHSHDYVDSTGTGSSTKTTGGANE